MTVSLAALARRDAAHGRRPRWALRAPAALSLSSAGRFSDRVGVRKPMLFGTAAIAVGAALPIAFPGLPILFASAAILGTGFMVFQVAAQNVTGELGGPSERAPEFQPAGPRLLDVRFHRPAGGGSRDRPSRIRDRPSHVLAAVPFAPFVVLARGGLALPSPARHDGPAHHGGVRACCATGRCAGLFAINALFALGWDLFTVFVPIYGARIGLSASEIGLVLSTFAAATFVVRFLMPRIARSYSEQQVLVIALFVAGAVYLLFPLGARRAGPARAGVLSRSRAGERPADGDGTPPHACAARADGRGGGRAHGARQHDGVRGAARLRRARNRPSGSRRCSIRSAPASPLAALARPQAARG